MKKIYNAPALECLEFFSVCPIGAEEEAFKDPNGSWAWNDGELGWT